MWGQLFGTIAGVVAGGAIAFFANYANERAKWDRSQAVRWDERRLSAYGQYSDCIRRMQVLADRIAGSHDLPSDGEPLSVEEGLPLLAEAEVARSAQWQQVLLLGNSRAIAVGYDLNRSTWAMEWFARGKITDLDDWRLVSAEAYRLRRQFIVEARNEMGVTGQVSSAPAWVPDWTPESLLTALRVKAEREKGAEAQPYSSDEFD